jgi:hypothetical protein
MNCVREPPNGAHAERERTRRDLAAARAHRARSRAQPARGLRGSCRYDRAACAPRKGRTPPPLTHDQFVAAFKTWVDANGACP